MGQKQTQKNQNQIPGKKQQTQKTIPNAAPAQPQKNQQANSQFNKKGNTSW